jgi:hypothetical protein
LQRIGINAHARLTSARAVDGITETMLAILGAGVPDPNAPRETVVRVGPETPLPSELFEDIP